MTPWLSIFMYIFSENTALIVSQKGMHRQDRNVNIGPRDRWEMTHCPEALHKDGPADASPTT
jgi:hypothetical protein